MALFHGRVSTFLIPDDVLALTLWFPRTKAILYSLVRAFRFSLGVKPDEVRLCDRGMMKPFLAKEMDKGSQLPLRISLVSE